MREGKGRALSKIGCYDDDDDAFSAASALIKIPLFFPWSPSEVNLFNDVAGKGGDGGSRCFAQVTSWLLVVR